MSAIPHDEAAARTSRLRRVAALFIARPERATVLPLAGVVAGLLIAASGVFRDTPEPLKEVPPGYAALVNQKGVLMSDLINTVENDATKSYDEATPEERRTALRKMIDEELLVQRAVVLDLPETTIEVREAMALGVEAQAAEPYWSLPPTDEELRAFFDKTRANYTNDGSMTVHDLVMRIGGFQNQDQSTAQAMSDAAEAVYRLRSGASIDDVMLHYGFVSSGRVNAPDELDFVAKMNLGDKLYEVATSLGDGEISDPVLDTDGVHVLVMEKRRQPRVADFASVRDNVYQAYRKAQSDRATAENVQLLRSQAEILLAPGQEE